MAHAKEVLIVDDEVGIRELLSEILQDEGYRVALAENAGDARAYRQRQQPALVLLDIWMPDTDGVTLLREWAANGQLTMPVVMMSGHGTIDTAVEATRIGAFDFLEKPIALQKLLATVGRALKRGEPQVKPLLMLATLGRAPVVAELKQRLERVANLKSPLLMVAEPGSGAELCARFVHQPNPLPGKLNAPWIEPENLSVLAEAPLDLLNQAREGTLILSEVADLNRTEQKGLLLIAAKLDKYNTRLICATARALPELVAQGAFDAKLYGIIGGVTVNVPNLRQHREDVPDLANLFLLRAVEAKEVQPRHFSTAALNAMRNYDWPGNLSQLENVVRTLALTATADEIGVNEVAQALPAYAAPAAATAPSALPLDLPLREARDAFERVYFEHHIAREGGNMSRVADSVGLERTHLYRKLKQLGIKLARRADD